MIKAKTLRELDELKQIKDWESICFDCGDSTQDLSVIHEGVALCPDCLKIELKDYPQMPGENFRQIIARGKP